MASQAPFPLMPPKSTEKRLEHFDEHVYVADSTTRLYKFVDAMCGDAGAGNLKKEIFLQRLSGAMNGIYGSQLDFIFGGVRFLSRTSSESYKYPTDSAMWTSDKWDEINAKDELYRSRIREFFAAATAGTTIDGIRRAVHAATSADCQVMENWRYIDNFGLQTGVGRALVVGYAATNIDTGHQHFFTADGNGAQALLDAQAFIAAQTDPTAWTIEQQQGRNEITVIPHKAAYGPREARLLRAMLDRITPQDAVVTINTQGLAVNAPIAIRACAADSTYYQVEKIVTPTPDIQSLPAPELLAIDLQPGEDWLMSDSPELAPYARFNITSEYGYYYLVSGGDRSPIDSVEYGTLNADGTVNTEQNFEWYETVEQYGPWTNYDKADSPDNYPGGQRGLTPTAEPAKNPDGSNYQFAYASQAAYVAARKAEVIALGGEADDLRYRLPVQQMASFKRTYTPDLAIAASAPSRDSTVTSSWTSRKVGAARTELRNPASFVR